MHLHPHSRRWTPSRRPQTCCCAGLRCPCWPARCAAPAPGAWPWPAEALPRAPPSCQTAPDQAHGHAAGCAAPAAASQRGRDARLRLMALPPAARCALAGLWQLLAAWLAAPSPAPRALASHAWAPLQALPRGPEAEQVRARDICTLLLRVMRAGAFRLRNRTGSSDDSASALEGAACSSPDTVACGMQPHASWRCTLVHCNASVSTDRGAPCGYHYVAPAPAVARHRCPRRQH